MVTFTAPSPFHRLPRRPGPGTWPLGISLLCEEGGLRALGPGNFAASGILVLVRIITCNSSAYVGMTLAASEHAFCAWWLERLPSSTGWTWEV